MWPRGAPFIPTSRPARNSGPGQRLRMRQAGRAVRPLQQAVLSPRKKRNTRPDHEDRGFRGDHCRPDQLDAAESGRGHVSRTWQPAAHSSSTSRQPTPTASSTAIHAALRLRACACHPTTSLTSCRTPTRQERRLARSCIWPLQVQRAGNPRRPTGCYNWWNVQA